MTAPKLSISSPAASPASYWFPAHDVPSAWRGHAPFAYWLMEALRPALVAELGTHNGFSFFVFTEAARRLELSTRVVALDSWEGDDHAGFYGESVYESVSRIAAEYPDTAELRRGYFSDSVDTFDDGTIDLLHIDGRHGYEDVWEDYETYLPKLAPDGVVIFHDTHERTEGFGVHRFWDEISGSAPSFEFHHSHGLGVLAPGATPPTAILDFFEVADREPEAVRGFYAELGAQVDRRAELADRAAEAEVLRDELARYGRSLEESIAQTHAITRTLSWRVTRPLRGVSRIVRGPRTSQ